MRWVRSTAGLALALGLALPATAGAASSTDYVARSFTGPAATGLPVTGPLAPRRAVARVRVLVPARWQRLSAPAGQLRLITPGDACRYRVTFFANAALTAPGTSLARIDALLPSPGARRVLDEGTRRGAAFRVTRPVSPDERVRLRALRTGILTRRADIVPAGQMAWADVRVAATSRAGDECHSGTYRENVGPALGDALAAARIRLTFTSP